MGFCCYSFLIEGIESVSIFTVLFRLSCSSNEKSGHVKQIQMSKTASASLSQHYQLAIAQGRNRQSGRKPTVPHSSPYNLLSPSKRNSRRSANEVSKAAGGALPASVHAKVTHVMQKVLRANTSSPCTSNSASHERSEPAAASECSPETNGNESSSVLEACSEPSATDLTLQQQALRVKASAEAVLHGIDWATCRADSGVGSVMCEPSGQSSSATCSNPHHAPEPDVGCEVTRQLTNAVGNSAATVGQPRRVKVSNPLDNRHQQCAVMSAKLASPPKTKRNRAGHPSGR